MAFDKSKKRASSIQAIIKNQDLLSLNNDSGKGSIDVLKTLTEIGLTPSETAVYLATLKLGTRPASIIANKAQLKRGQTYNVLASLTEKGLVQEFVKSGVRHFTCSPIESLLSIVENREKEIARNKEHIKSLIPELEKLQNPISGKPRVRFYQGLEGIKEIFEDMLRGSTSDMYSFVDLRHSWSGVDVDAKHWITHFIKRREEKDIWWNAIAVKSPDSDSELVNRSKRKRRVKLIEGLELPAEVNIYKNKVALTSHGEELMGVVIESAPIVETLKNLHRYLWEKLPDYDDENKSQSSEEV